MAPLVTNGEKNYFKVRKWFFTAVTSLLTLFTLLSSVWAIAQTYTLKETDHRFNAVEKEVDNICIVVEENTENIGKLRHEYDVMISSINTKLDIILKRMDK
jgi:hypothetical protein